MTEGGAMTAWYLDAFDARSRRGRLAQAAVPAVM